MATVELIRALEPAPAEDRYGLLPCEVYQAWQAAAQDAEEAFLDWCDAPYGRKAEAYTVFLAAADREAAAADRWLVV